MEKKMMTTIFVAALVAVVVAVIARGVGPNLAPRTESSNAPATINAHRCDADGICEINDGLVQDSLDINGNLDVGGLVELEGDLQVSGDLQLGENSVECKVFEVINNGEDTCANNGYNLCIAQEIVQTTTYYNTLNSSCNGLIQAQFKETHLRTCTSSGGGGGGGGCGFNSQGAEPYYGGIGGGSSAGKVLCCR